MKNFKGKVIGMATASLMVVGLSIPTVSFADTVTSEEISDFNLVGGELELETSPVVSFGELELTAQPETHKTSFETNFNVKDATGLQRGWRVDVSASQFKVVEPEGGFASGTEAYELPVGSLSLSPLDDISRVGIGTGVLPKDTVDRSTLIDDGAVKVAEARVGEGMGEFDLTYAEDALSLVVDSTTAKLDEVNYPDGITPYEATLTWNLIQAP
ncbi:WxL domain-containing protein [Virgibacillus sp. Bac332]|uniref:WxL domain-containing protein n=1 Tax=Virgibacillus sp. Bac332 TaxID=2419842 RepID=UPI000EF46301|nr:WxL domain-containing protein [Virgibacillus sp. Bac332]